MNSKTIKLIEENCLGIAFSMNDTFYYACADISNIDFDELQDLESVIEKYGYDAIIAYEAIKRGHDPQIPQHITPEFLASKKMIEDIMNNASEFGEFYTLRDTIKMRAKTPEERKKVSKKISLMKQFFSFWTNR